MPEIVLGLPKFHPKQRVVWTSKANEILLGGDTRGGKSFYIRKAYIRMCAEIPGLLCDIFRVNFDDVIRNYMEGETSFPVLLDLWEKEGFCKINQTEIVFWNESRISLEHCADDKVMQKHQGVARHVRTLEESAQMVERRVRALSGWVTMSEEMKSRVPEKWKGTFPRIYHSTNPIGPSANFYRKNFVMVAKPLQTIDPPYAVFEGGPLGTRQYVPFFTDDNPSEDYAATQRRIKEAFPDEAIHKALLDGKSGESWDTLVGEYFPEFDEDRHVLKEDIQPPDHWFRFRALDLGYAEPFYVAWIAVSDGEVFRDHLGRELWFPRGAFVQYLEWYGCDIQDTSKGVRMRNEDIAAGIVSRSELFAKSVPTLTDSLPFQDRGGEQVPKVFAKEGCPITLGDTSRVVGWNQFRARMIGIETQWSAKRVPLFFWNPSCTYARDYIPQLTRHPAEHKREDAQEHGEPTHVCDTLRIASMAHTVVRDLAKPTAQLIEREIKASKPSVRQITRQGGAAYF
jgi:hypothetical protein